MSHATIARPLLWLMLGIVMLLVSGCAGLKGLFSRSEEHTKTSVVEYLYPNAKDPITEQGVPVLTLPLRVGIAFVPERHRGFLSEARKTEFLSRVAEHFKKQEFIKSIEIIPSDYLTPKGGFANLDQIRTMYGIDVIALVSYDQAQFTDEGVASLIYWTIVGAYVVPGEKNSTSTMVDTVIMHIPSRKMLFRAPGVGQVKGYATPINLSEQLRKDSDKAMDEAVNKMIANLDGQLVAFQERVKSSPEEYKVVRTPGYKGGGALDAGMALCVSLIVAGGGWWARRRR
ncbi:MAG: rhombotarget lipoprotein [Burkholderiales bacterium]